MLGVVQLCQRETAGPKVAVLLHLTYAQILSWSETTTREGPFGDPGNPVVKQRGREVRTFVSRFPGAPQMIKRSPQHSEETRGPQGTERDKPDPNKLGASTRFDFLGRNLTPYGGLLPLPRAFAQVG